MALHDFGDRAGDGLEAAQALVRDLGPACEAVVRGRWAQRALRMRLDRGGSPQDALVALLSVRARRDRAVASELLRDVMGDLVAFGSRIMPPFMRRLHDPDDLVVSVLGDCFREVFQTPIGGREELLVILRGRIRWKSRERGRRMSSLKRRDDLRRVDSDQAVEQWSSGPSPPDQAEAREELQAIVRLLRSLSGHERTVLSLHLMEHTPAEIAERVQMTPDGVRRIVQRLLGRTGGSA